MKKIKISIPSLFQKFQPCEPNYIRQVCHGRCCQGSGRLLITVHDSEIERIKNLSAELEGNFIKGKNGLCPFKKNHLCGIHEDKPFGYKASPFTLSKNDVLIIRNRYRMLRCYNTPNAIPAYRAHRWSLEQIFGKDETQKIIDKIEGGALEIISEISDEKYIILKENDLLKKKKNV